MAGFHLTDRADDEASLARHNISLGAFCCHWIIQMRKCPDRLHVRARGKRQYDRDTSRPGEDQPMGTLIACEARSAAESHGPAPSPTVREEVRRPSKYQEDRRALARAGQVPRRVFQRLLSERPPARPVRRGVLSPADPVREHPPAESYAGAGSRGTGAWRSAGATCAEDRWSSHHWPRQPFPSGLSGSFAPGVAAAPSTW
jgi:hypothetical protein